MNFSLVSSALESSNVSTIRGSARGFGPSAQNERGQENVYCLRTRGLFQIQINYTLKSKRDIIERRTTAHLSKQKRKLLSIN